MLVSGKMQVQSVVDGSAMCVIKSTIIIIKVNDRGYNVAFSKTLFFINFVPPYYRLTIGKVSYYINISLVEDILPYYCVSIFLTSVALIWGGTVIAPIITQARHF